MTTYVHTYGHTVPCMSILAICGDLGYMVIYGHIHGHHSGDLHHSVSLRNRGKRNCLTRKLYDGPRTVQHVVQTVISRQLMVVYMTVYMSIHDHLCTCICPCMDIYNQIWQWMTIYDHIWPYITIYRYWPNIWPYITVVIKSITVNDHQPQWITINWTSMAMGPSLRQLKNVWRYVFT